MTTKTIIIAIAVGTAIFGALWAGGVFKSIFKKPDE